VSAAAEGSGKYLLVAGVAIAIVVADQLTKLWVTSALALHEVVPVIPGWVDLTYVRNTGAAFSLLAGRSAAFRLPFFTVVAILAGVAIIGFVRQTPGSQRTVLLSCAAVLGGAAGNLVDRLRHGEVVDFVLVHWRDWYWPAFNVADSFITVGVVLLLGHALFVRDDGAATAEAERPR
jgi:signal peptidase II